jgi:hypothetical protein
MSFGIVGAQFLFSEKTENNLQSTFVIVCANKKEKTYK